MRKHHLFFTPEVFTPEAVTDGLAAILADNPDIDVEVEVCVLHGGGQSELHRRYVLSGGAVHEAN